jgi:hypothetical protein
MVVTVTKALKEQYQKHLILPISLPCRPYFRHIVQGIKDFEPEFYHFCLIASEASLARRIRARDGEAGAWALRQIPRCVKAFKDPEFEERLNTDIMSLENITETIFSRIVGRACFE